MTTGWILCPALHKGQPAFGFFFAWRSGGNSGAAGGRAVQSRVGGGGVAQMKWNGYGMNETA